MVKFARLFFPIVSLVLITIGTKFLFDPKISLSIYRLFLFGYLPISLGIIFFFLNIKYQIILFNISILLLLCFTLFEILLIFEENRNLKGKKYETSYLGGVPESKKKEVISGKLVPKFCAGFYKNLFDLKYLKRYR